MMGAILGAIPWSAVFGLVVKGVLYWLDKAEETREMKRDFLLFVEKFHEHRKIPVQLNEKWAKMVKDEKIKSEIEIVNKNAEVFWAGKDNPYSET